VAVAGGCSTRPVVLSAAKDLVVRSWRDRDPSLRSGRRGACGGKGRWVAL